MGQKKAPIIPEDPYCMQHGQPNCGPCKNDYINILIFLGCLCSCILIGTVAEIILTDNKPPSHPVTVVPCK